MAHEERWFIINLDKRQYIEMYFKPGHLDGTGESTPLGELLKVALPPKTVDDILGQPRTATACTRYTVKQGTGTGLLHLPPELWLEIFPVIGNQLSGLQDLICFSMINKQFSELGWKYVYDKHKEQRWCNGRIVHMRADMPVARESEDGEILLPEGIFEDPEREEIEAYAAKHNTQKMCQFFEDVFKRIDAHTRAEVDFLLGEKLPPTECKVYSEWGNPRSADETSGTVLCNLSKKEYIREEDVQRLAHALGVDPRDFEFSNVLMRRTYWRTGDGGRPFLGKWAGDRFEVTDMSKIKKFESEWSDGFPEIEKEYAP